MKSKPETPRWPENPIGRSTANNAMPRNRGRASFDRIRSKARSTTPEDMALAEDARILARLFAQEGVRNTLLEDFHAGRTPVTQTGDWSDVMVVTPEETIPWKEASRLSDPEMRALMLNVEKRLAALLFALLLHEQEGHRAELLDEARRQCSGPQGVSWDRPQSI